MLGVDVGPSPSPVRAGPVPADVLVLLETGPLKTLSGQQLAVGLRGVGSSGEQASGRVGEGLGASLARPS